MKRFVKILKIFTLAFAFCVSVFMCVSCEKEVKLESVELITKEGTPTVYTVGEFSYDGYKLLKTYSDGTIEEVPFSEEFLSPVEILKMWQPGEQTVSFEYEGESFSITCTFNRNNFDNVELLPLDIVYDGKPHEVQFSAAVPSGTEIKINSGSSLFYTDAGTYTASVSLSKDGYIPKDLTAEVNIAKAKYDTSTFTFEDETFQYDKAPHALEIKGKLPQGVSVRYTMNGSQGNTAVNIGEYKVTAEFTYTNSKNYEPLEPITKVLKITKRYIDLTAIERNLKNKLNKDLLYYDGESKLSTITSDMEFPKEINTETVTYAFKRQGETELIDDVVYAGDYQIIISFDIRFEYKNECALSQDYIVVDFSVQQAFFSTSHFADLTTTYTGEPQTLKIQEDVIPPSYKYQPIYYIKPFGASDSEYVLGNSATNAGKYTVKVEFPVDDNFATVPTKTATLTINKYYYDLTMPESVSQEYDGTVYTLQDVVNSVNNNISKFNGLALTVKGLGVNGDILPDVEEHIVPTNVTVNLDVTLKMYKVNYIKDENEYSQFIENIKNIFKSNTDKESFDKIQKQKVEKTDGIGIYLIIGSCESDEYEAYDKLVIFSISPRITDFSRPENGTRINYDGQNHAKFFDLEIPSYVINEGKNFYTKRIFEIEQDGTKKREVTEVISAGYYCCEYQLIDDPNFAYTCGSQFTVDEFEIRRVEVSAKSLEGFTFTTLVVKSEQDIINEAKNNIAERYPLLEYGRDYTLAVIDSNSDPVTFPIDNSKQYYLQFTLKDEVNYVSYDGINPITVFKQKFDIINPKPIDNIQLISTSYLKPDSDEGIFYMDDVTDVRSHIRDSIFTTVYDYKGLIVESISFYTIGGEKIADDKELNTVGKYYVEIPFVDSLYYTIDGKNTDMKKTIYFEYKKKIIINTKTDERLKGNTIDENFKYIFYSADNYKVSNVISMTNDTLTYYMNEGLKLKENPKMLQVQTDGSSVQRDNNYSLVNGGEFKITYNFQDNYDFVIDGRSTNLTYTVPVKVIKITELKDEYFNFALDTKGANIDMYSDIVSKLHTIVSGYTNLKIKVVGDKEQFTIKKNSTTYTRVIDTGTFNATVSFENNGIYYKALTTPIDGKYYTLDDLIFNFTVEIKSNSPQIGTVYYKAIDENSDYCLNMCNAVKLQIGNDGVVSLDLIENISINKDGRQLNSIYGRDFGYYTYKVTYKDKQFYADSTGTIVLAPYKKVYIEADTHGGSNSDNFQSLYSEFMIQCDNPSYGRLTNPRFKGRAYNIYDYFVNIKGYNMSFGGTDSGSYYIDGYAVNITVSEQHLKDYENWEYGFFVFGNNFKKTLLDRNKFFRVEVKGYEMQSHGYTVKYNGTDTNVSL